jgi:hypothetical protein
MFATQLALFEHSTPTPQLDALPEEVSFYLDEIMPFWNMASPLIAFRRVLYQDCLEAHEAHNATKEHHLKMALKVLGARIKELSH